MVLWKSGAGHFYGNPQQRWSHSWIHCDGPELVAALRSARIKTNSPIPIFNPSRIETYLLDLYEELIGHSHPDEVIVHNTFVNLVREAGRRRRGSGQRSIPEAILRVRSLIDRRYDQPLTLRELAAEAHLSIPHLCTEFRRHLGLPPIAYLIKRRMQTAISLLRGTSYSIGQIGQLVGYNDPHHFSKFFKAHYGVPPSYLRSTKS